MKDNFDFFVFSVFKDTSLEKIKSLLKEIYKEEYQLGKLIFSKEHFSLNNYFNPSVSGKKDEVFTFWQEASLPNYIFFVSNSVDGKYTLCNCLSNRISCDYLMCRMSSKNAKDHYPMNGFNYIRKRKLRLGKMCFSI